MDPDRRDYQPHRPPTAPGRPHAVRGGRSAWTRGIATLALLWLALIQPLQAQLPPHYLLLSPPLPTAAASRVVDMYIDMAVDDGGLGITPTIYSNSLWMAGAKDGTINISLNPLTNLVRVVTTAQPRAPVIVRGVGAVAPNIYGWGITNNAHSRRVNYTFGNRDRVSFGFFINCALGGTFGTYDYIGLGGGADYLYCLAEDNANSGGNGQKYFWCESRVNQTGNAVKIPMTKNVTYWVTMLFVRAGKAKMEVRLASTGALVGTAETAVALDDLPVNLLSIGRADAHSNAVANLTQSVISAVMVDLTGTYYPMLMP